MQQIHILANMLVVICATFIFVNVLPHRSALLPPTWDVNNENRIFYVIFSVS